MFEDATIESNSNNNSQKNIQDDALVLTTDDLVLFLGEKYVESKVQSRTITVLKKKIKDLESELYKIQSCNILEEHKVSELKTEFELQINALKEENKSLRIKKVVKKK